MIISSREYALSKTLGVLEDILNLKKAIFPIEMVRQFQKDFVEQLIRAWEEGGDIVGVAAKLKEALPYVDKPMLFDFKIAQCMSYVSHLKDPKPIPLFTLN